MAYTTRIRDLDALPESSVAPVSYEHPDFVLAAAVRAGVITAAKPS